MRSKSFLALVLLGLLSMGRGVLDRDNLVDLVTQSKSPTPQKAADLRIALFARIIRA